MKMTPKASRDRVLGICFLLAPPYILLASLAIFSVVSVFASLFNGLFPLVKLLLTSVSFLSLLACFAGVPLGIYFLVRKKSPVKGEKFDPRSGKKANSTVPDEIKTWNWGAAGLGWLWGPSYSVWLFLLGFISPLSLFWWIVMGVYGNEWAWKAQRWKSVEDFQLAQAKWTVWGIISLVFDLFLLIFTIYVILAFLQDSNL